ncbi:MAG: LPXTG cell wall anchor domain-containing protein [Alphaproteobacteria bacterium]|nr:LPXTG cell wall anchor domain-containing protein [Alphaproteobacteria bacterium]
MNKHATDTTNILLFGLLFVLLAGVFVVIFKKKKQAQ